MTTTFHTEVPAHGTKILFCTGNCWHQTLYPAPCGCGVASQPLPIAGPYFAWRPVAAGIPDFAAEAAPCVVGTIVDDNRSTSYVNPGGFMLGDPVRIEDKHRHLYEDFGDDLYVDGFGTRKEDSAPVVRFLDRTTGVYGHIPPGWLRHRNGGGGAGGISVVHSSTPEDRSLQATARTLLVIPSDEMLAAEIGRRPDLPQHLAPKDAGALIVRLAAALLKATAPPVDWTRGPEGRSNTSDAMRLVVEHITRVLVDCGSAVGVRGMRAEAPTIAGLIVAQLAHGAVEGVGPIGPLKK